LKLKQTKLIVI